MVAGSEDPAVERRRLRVELRDLRKKAGHTQRDVARAMDWSTSKLIRIENGDVRITVNDLRALLAHYGLNDKRKTDQLLDMARTSRRESWIDFRNVHSAGFLAYLGFESSATIIRSYDINGIPGLLQTEEYAIPFLTDTYGVAREVAERRWEARQRRQELHDRAHPPEMFFVLDESVVRRHVGGSAVMRRQLEQLKDWSSRSHITLQILPFEAGAYRAMAGTFVLLEFPNPNDDDLLYTEDATGSTTTRDDIQVTTAYRETFYEAEDRALSPEASLALLDDVIGGLRPANQPANAGVTPQTT